MKKKLIAGLITVIAVAALSICTYAVSGGFTIEGDVNAKTMELMHKHYDFDRDDDFLLIEVIKVNENQPANQP